MPERPYAYLLDHQNFRETLESNMIKQATFLARF
jgi:hypothetical protein